MTVVIVGGGAAGLMAAIWAARTDAQRSIILLDGAKRLGAKILIAGGGRCNVTHHEVAPEDFCGSSRNAIKKVITRFGVPETLRFFQELGVHLKREPTGKLFPTTNRAQTVLDALLGEAKRLGVKIDVGHRVENIRPLEPSSEGAAARLELSGPWGTLHADQVILCTGGKSVPKTGSDGHGLELAKRLGHELTPKLVPSLVPLALPPKHPLTTLSGISLPANFELRRQSGKRLVNVSGDVLFTHKGLSGPAVLDISRHWILAHQDGDAVLAVNWLPDASPEELDQTLQSLGKRPVRAHLRPLLADRLVDLLLSESGIPADACGSDLTQDQRKSLVQAATDQVLPITGDLGFKVAEVTAGGVPLVQIDLKTMQSRKMPGLYLCGEICDVDGRIGGFNFQWAWSSGYVAGISV
ncbi:MAG: NAD(P)/FAD-dependent oxidoreductase [Pirellulaceae bacterium]